MRKALRDVKISSFFWLRVGVIALIFIAFIISIELEVSLLALAKSIYYPRYFLASDFLL